MSNWEGLTTRRGNRPNFVGRKRGRPLGSKKIMPKTKKDEQQDKQIKNVQKHVKKIIRMEELKHVDTIISSIAAASDPGVAQTILLNGLSQGNSNLTRVGDEVMYTSIQVKGFVNSDTDMITLGAVVRMIVFWDKSPNGVAPTAANLLDNSVITTYVNAPYNSDYYKRFKILYDRRLALNPQVLLTAATTEPLSVPFDFRKGFNRQSNYGLGNAGTIADITRGACYILLLSNYAAASASVPTVQAGVRLIFKEL